MGNEEFLSLCKAKVAEYTNAHMDKTDQKQISVNDVYVVWSCKTLQNNKALLSTTDLHDDDHEYREGDVFPREGIKVSKERLEELASDKNLRGTPVIELVKEPEK